jgi:fructokinase
MKSYDVVALGELLVDFTNFADPADGGRKLYQANPGGAPCNVLAMMARLGKRTAFIGKVGNDFFGRMLRQSLIDAGIDPIGLSVSEEAPTSLAFVQNDESGDREFTFYRNPGADTLLHEDDLKDELLSETRLFHFGSVSMTHEVSRRATWEAVRRVSALGIPISFDPNVRLALWQDKEELKEQMAQGCQQCQILKISADELTFLTGEESLAGGLKVLLDRYAPFQFIFITDGVRGSYAWHGGELIYCPTFEDVATIDTTGAGDTFMGVCLSSLLDLTGFECDSEQLSQILRRANAAASLITTRHGALAVMPTLQEMEQLLGK